ncbi:hypothetical protein BC939DRAFT_474939 [Gamsiella multidivaricata]|uniref:uncharacterized protein n=1 Tax=Gamsiella multidivaricata TaxID=101098 RepID=UPI002220E6FC|nr:uncharacterized protein BC939DRAFT_474939 [Gamsiella multidivaricata]KAI7828220.1 hypothetical protein BC939DRAFT_474939 [Gamsiella multidivaricata]
MEFVHRAIPHRVRRLFSKPKEGNGPEDSYRLRRMESHASMSPTKRRRIYLNLTPESIESDLDAPNEALPHYPANKVTTSKYDLFSFIPKNLFEQFRRLANLYFLFVAGLSIAPILGGFAPFLTFLPLIFIITVTAIKDAIEDWKRRKSDEAFNNAPVILLCNWTNTNVHSRGSSKLQLIQDAISGLFSWATASPRKSQPNRADAINAAALAATTPSGRSDQNSYFEGHYANSAQGAASEGQDPAGRPARRVRRNIPHSVLNHTESYSAKPAFGAKWQDCIWQDVKVGDIVYLKNDDPIPADIVILSTSEADGLCFIETKNLDGETNLKIRRGLTATKGLKTPAAIERAAFYVESESPHANLYSYQGALKWLISDGADMPAGDRVVHNKTESITINEILLRGCVLRNTEHVIGMVLFTGTDTKIMLNSGDTPSKRSRIEKDLNFHIVMNFIILFALSIGSAIANGVIFGDTENNSGTFFEYGADASTPFMSAFITFCIEIVKTAQAYFIHKDVDMYDERVNQACVPKTWNISDDLGQIEYIFSDKTGTLTQNVMEFQKCTINGIDYGIGETDATRGQKMSGDGEFEPMEFESDEAYLEKLNMERLKMKAAMDRLFDNKYYSDKTTFVDSDLFEDMADPASKHAKAIMNFWTALAVCHTVITERDIDTDPYKIEYKAQSPDEAALVSTARDVGFVFLEKKGPMMHLEIMGQPRVYKILNILEFNSNRKRMSIILRPPEGGIVLVCKGADSVIYERLDKAEEQSKLREDTLVDLERFANEGLRTLCLAYRKISEEEYANWVLEYDEACNTIHNRDENIENACEEIEHSLILLGGTAIEDRLQVGVPECIALLSRAGIKLWVLTGDKTETAINIGFACNLLQRDMILIIIQAQDKEDTREQLMKALDKFWGREAEKDPSLANKSHALIIDGETLKYGLSPALNGLLLDVGKRCKSVICCRVSPLQKAKVVSMVKRGLDVMTLSIGDGANDVSMIQEANIGVGIAGEEGRQAVMASDFAIAQFRFLSKLLLVHGRWSYIRISEMILTFFYKNIVWTLTIFWFQFFSGFTALLLFDYTFVVLYNLLFTSLPIMFMGAFDQDVDAKTSMQFPALYLRGIKQKHFTRSKFWLYVLDALYQSVICFFVPWYLSNDLYASGHSTNDLVALGTLISACSVVVANLYVGLNMFHWTKMIFTVIFGSIIVFFLYCWVYANFFTIENTFYGMDHIILNSPAFWLAIILSVVLTMLPHYVYKFARQYLKPNDIIIVREQLYREKHPSKKERRARKLKAMRESEMNRTNSSFQDPGIVSSGSHVLGDDDMEDDLDQIPVIKNSPTILSPEDPNDQKPGDIRQRQPSPSPMASLSRVDEAYYLKASSDGAVGAQPQRELVGRRRVASSNNTFNAQGENDIYGGIEIATPAKTFNNDYSVSSTSLPAQSDTLEPIDRKFAQGYPTTSFSFNQEFINAAATATGGVVGGPLGQDRPRVKRQSTPSVPLGGPNFRFMGDDSPPPPGSGNGRPINQKPAHTGFAFSTDDASAFVYSHLNRVHSASNDEMVSAARAKRASHMHYGGRNSIDGSEVGSPSNPGSPTFDFQKGKITPPDTRSPFGDDASSGQPSPPICDATGVDSSRRESLTRRPRGPSRSMTAPDIPVAELGAMLLQQQKDMEKGIERLNKAQASVRAAAQQRQSIQKVRFQGASEVGSSTTSIPAPASSFDPITDELSSSGIQQHHPLHMPDNQHSQRAKQQ